MESHWDGSSTLRRKILERMAVLITSAEYKTWYIYQGSGVRNMPAGPPRIRLVITYSAADEKESGSTANVGHKVTGSHEQDPGIRDGGNDQWLHVLGRGLLPSQEQHHDHAQVIGGNRQKRRLVCRSLVEQPLRPKSLEDASQQELPLVEACRHVAVKQRLWAK